MRDLLVVGIVVLAALAALRRPWIGVMLWTWLSIMNPHRYTFGFAYGAPLAQLAAISTFVGLLLTRDRRTSPLQSGAVTALLLFVIWMNVSWLAGLDIEGDFEQWSKVMKIDLMILLSMMLLHTKKHVIVLAWVSAGSLMLLGAKGGLFTITSGGTERLWGPPGTFINDNNEFGLALIMTIPLIYFLQMQVRNALARHLMTVAMLLCAAAALGTHSRGALLAISAMTLLLWWRGRSKLLAGIVIAAMTAFLVNFMPSNWTERMQTIETYQDDGSAQGRLAAWSAAWGIALHYPAGVGFNQVRQELFDRYSHNPEAGARAAHSIYFQILGNHGFVGLALFLAIWAITWRHAAWLRTHASRIPEARWCADLGAMAQVSLLGYFVGGAFLSLAYFDLPYNVMMMVAVARAWVLRKAWETEPPETRSIWALIGVATPKPPMQARVR